MKTSPRLTAVATALPPHVVTQASVRTLAEALFGPAFAANERRLFAVFDSAGIDRRHVCMPLEWFAQPHDLGECNTLYLEHALELSVVAARSALDRAGLAAGDVDHIVFVSSSGLATPSLDARIANRLPLRSDVRRTPIWGLGCAGGAAGLSRAREFALADPDACVLLIALELCSLTFQHGDLTRQNLVAASLFGDGAAAVVVLGARAAADSRGAAGGSRTAAGSPGSGATASASAPPGTGVPQRPLELVASGSRLWPGTLDVMGWNVDRLGMHVVFSRDIPTIVREWVRPALDDFLARHGLELGAIDHVVTHPGGPKVLAAYSDALALPPDAFRHSRAVLRECGNMSSPTCLFVLERALGAGDIAPGEFALLGALGPGFSSEMVLMRGAD